jgi:hypothetical protein
VGDGVSRGRALAAALAAVWIALACAKPIVDDEVHEIDPKTLTRIAVVPILPASDFHGSGDPGTTTGGDAAEAAAIVTRIASDALLAKGFDVIPASDVVQLFESAGKPIPHGDEAAFAAAVASEFGATSALFGTVYRYRERRGGELGATRPASVGLELRLSAAPSGRLLWTARFDHTQHALSENALEARRYPGAGSRWLSAAELTRWGLDAAADRLTELR